MRDNALMLRLPEVQLRWLEAACKNANVKNKQAYIKELIRREMIRVEANKQRGVS